MYVRGIPIRQALRGVVLLTLRVTHVPLPVNYSRLKSDDTSGFENHLLHPPFPLTRRYEKTKSSGGILGGGRGHNRVGDTRVI